jgi:energy-coupling factor transporter ATP-binding protein EcfA2
MSDGWAEQNDAVGEVLLVIGPIASGKSTVAAALGARLREAGRAIAVLDLDDVVETIGGFEGLSWERFDDALAVLGNLVAAWLIKGMDVIAHGPFFQQHEVDAVLGSVPPETQVRRVHLHSTYEVALGRVAQDPSRKRSADHPFLRATYERVESLLPTMPQCDWRFDTTIVSWREIVDQLMTELSK